ncbi:MAG: HD domain-containing protein [Candidatus Micrarchaeia archaeon]
MDYEGFVKFFSLTGRLKDIARMGWVMRGVRNAESVGDHSFRTALMALILAPEFPEINAEKAVKLALIHDVCEVYTKDIATRPKEDLQIVSNEKKHELEMKAVETLSAFLPNFQAKELLDLYKECEEKKSAEAKFVKQIEVIETALQAADYERQGRNKESLEELFVNARNKVSDPKLKKLLDNIEEWRKQKSTETKTDVEREIDFLFKQIKRKEKKGWKE